MDYGLSSRISIKDSIAITFLGLIDIYALVYEKIFWRPTAPHIMTVPFEQTKGYLEKINKKPLRENSSYYRLKRKKVFQVDEDKIKIDLNSQWWREFLNFKFRFFVAPPKWNKKWTVVLYDIPEKNSLIRDKIRKIFKNLGLKNWQRSVWITVNPITPQLRELLTDWELLDFVTVFSGQNLFSKSDSKMIKKLFNPEKLYEKYKDFNSQLISGIKSKNEILKKDLISKFPNLISDDDGLPSEFFPDPEIRKKLFKNYNKLVASSSKTS